MANTKEKLINEYKQKENAWKFQVVKTERKDLVKGTAKPITKDSIAAIPNLPSSWPWEVLLFIWITISLAVSMMALAKRKVLSYWA